MLRSLLFCLSLFYFVSCGGEHISSGKNPDSGQVSEYQGLKVITFNPEDNGSLWLFNSQGFPEEKIIDSSLFPEGGELGPVSFLTPDQDQILAFWKIDNTHHLYKLTISSKSFIKLKVFGEIEPKPFCDEVLKMESSSFCLFAAETPDHGFELWRSDGTIEGTYLVKDIVSGVNSSFGPSSRSHYFNGQYYFTAVDSKGVQQLWRTDGTSNGTKKVSSFETNLSIDFYEYKDFFFINRYGDYFQVLKNHQLIASSRSCLYGGFVLKGKIISECSGSITAYNPLSDQEDVLKSDVQDLRLLGKDSDKAYFLVRDGEKVNLYSTEGTVETNKLIGVLTENADTLDSASLMTFTTKSAPILISLDHTYSNKKDPQVYKISGNSITNITQDILSALDISWEDYNIFFRATEIFDYDFGLKRDPSDEYHLMIEGQDGEGHVFAKTKDFSSYHYQGQTRPELVTDLLSGLQYFMAPMYAGFYYKDVYFELDGKKYYFNYFLLSE